MQIVILTKLLLVVSQCKIKNLVGSSDLKRNRQLTQSVIFIYTT